jgi:hypothetical protein
MKYVPNGVSRAVSRSLLHTQKHSPTILFAAGVVGVVGSTVLACRATLKVHEVLNDDNKDRELMKDAVSDSGVQYSTGEYRQDLTISYLRSSGRLAKLYGPSVVLGVASIGALAGAHRIQNNRIAAISAAYTAVDKAFSQYRARVIDEYGEDKDREFRYGVDKYVEQEETTSGVKKKEVKKAAGTSGSPYARVFGPGNTNYKATPEFNLLFLKMVQNWCNDRLQQNGHLFLNEVFDELGLDRTTAGQRVGWIYQPDDPKRDSWIDFGVWEDRTLDKFHDFQVGRENSIILDFNVDGDIHELI